MHENFLANETQSIRRKQKIRCAQRFLKYVLNKKQALSTKGFSSNYVILDIDNNGIFYEYWSNVNHICGICDSTVLMHSTEDFEEKFGTKSHQILVEGFIAYLKKEAIKKRKDKTGFNLVTKKGFISFDIIDRRKTPGLENYMNSSPFIFKINFENK